MSKTVVIGQNFRKSPKWAKKCQFLGNQGKKIPDSKFLQGYRYSNTLEGTKEKVLGSFQPKLMSKFEVISQKLKK